MTERERCLAAVADLTEELNNLRGPLKYLRASAEGLEVMERVTVQTILDDVERAIHALLDPARFQPHLF